MFKNSLAKLVLRSFSRAMVGSPKRLADLAKIEANLAVRCRACGSRRVFDIQLLGRHLVHTCQNSTWSELPRAIPCQCGSIDLSLAPVPFAAGVVDPQMGRYHRRVAEVAMEVLLDVGRPAHRGSPSRHGIRLALRALLPWASAQLLTAFWHAAEDDDRERRAPALTRCYGAIETELRMLGRFKPAEAFNETAAS